MTQLNPYLNFRDNTREAMEFYQTIFGGELVLNTFEESQIEMEASEKNKIMHSMLISENGLMFMASDTPNSMELNVGNNIHMSLSGDNEDELKGYWEKLLDGGTQIMPLEKAPWGDTFGMLVDKFGINWMVNITGKQD